MKASYIGNGFRFELDKFHMFTAMIAQKHSNGDGKLEKIIFDACAESVEMYKSLKEFHNV